MPTHRKEKVSSQIQREISNIILKYFSETNIYITVTDVQVTADFKEAKIFISVFQKNKQDEILEKLEKNKIEIRRLLGQRIKLKFLPHLNFVIDTGIEKIQKVEKLLMEIKDES